MHLIETGPVCLSLTDHGSWGVTWLQKKVDRDQAILDLTAQISNAANRPMDVTIIARILDDQGKEVTTAGQSARLAPVVTAPYWLRLHIHNPHLWHGRQDPYLYAAVVQILDGNGVLLDQIDHRIGIRWSYVDPEKKFFLNGEPYHLHGVNRHQDRPDKGWAITAKDQQEDLDWILDMGSTVVRCAHYQHSDYFYSLCDKVGLLVWAKLPLVDRIDPSQEFADTSP